MLRLPLLGAMAAYALGAPLAMAGLAVEKLPEGGSVLAPITLAEQTTAEQPSSEQKEVKQALDQEEASLAKKLANPVAALISIPFQFNWDDRIGAVAVAGRRVWALALAEGGVIVALSLALVWTNARGSVVPWVVEVDRFGEARAVGPAIADFQPTDAMIAVLAKAFGE